MPVEKMNEIAVIECEIATLPDMQLKELYVDYIPKVEKRCRDLKKEVKERIAKNGECAGLKTYKENAGVIITDIEGFYKEHSEHITKEEFIGECVIVNLTAFKKVVIDRIQRQLLTEKGESRSKKQIEEEINFKAREHGTAKTKNVTM